MAEEDAQEPATQQSEKDVVVAPAGTIMGEGNRGYEILKPIGKGKFAIVYRARKLSDGEIVALKRVRCDQMDEKQKQKALKEVKLVESLNHPNIVQYLDSWYEGNELVIALEWAAAGDLKRQIRKAVEKKQNFDERIIWNYFAQIANAIKYMHEQNIMHRDLKPANIFLTLNGEIKVGDLGLGRQLSEQTLQGGGQVHSKVGTPLYMSPEVLHGEGYDFSSDVWSVGCLLYELAMLKSPFKSEGLNLYSLFQKINKGDYLPLPLQYSKELVDLAYSMLNLEPKSRPTLEQVTQIASHYRQLTNSGVRPFICENQERPSFEEYNDDVEDKRISDIKDNVNNDEEQFHSSQNRLGENNDDGHAKKENTEDREHKKPQPASSYDYQQEESKRQDYHGSDHQRISDVNDGDDEDEEVPAPPPVRPMSHRKQYKKTTTSDGNEKAVNDDTVYNHETTPFDTVYNHETTPFAAHKTIDQVSSRQIKPQNTSSSVITVNHDPSNHNDDINHDSKTISSMKIDGKDVAAMELLWHKLDVLGYMNYRRGFKQSPSAMAAAFNSPFEASSFSSPRSLPKKLPPLLTTHFAFSALMSHPWISSPQQQFLDFVHAAHWLLDTLGLAKNYFDYGRDAASMEAPHVISRALLVAIGAAGFPPERAQNMNPAALAVGYGEAPLEVLLWLSNKILTTCPPNGLFDNIQHSRHVNEEEGLVHDDDDEINDEINDVFDENEFIEEGNEDEYHNVKEDVEDDKQEVEKNIIWSPIDNNQWLEELERVRSRLNPIIFNESLNWQHRLSTIQTHLNHYQSLGLVHDVNDDDDGGGLTNHGGKDDNTRIMIKNSKNLKTKNNHHHHDVTTDIQLVENLGKKLKEICENMVEKERMIIGGDTGEQEEEKLLTPQSRNSISLILTPLQTISKQHQSFLKKEFLLMQKNEINIKNIMIKTNEFNILLESVNDLITLVNENNEATTNIEPLRQIKLAKPELIKQCQEMELSQGILSSQLFRYNLTHNRLKKKNKSLKNSSMTSRQDDMGYDEKEHRRSILTLSTMSSDSLSHKQFIDDGESDSEEDI